MKPEMAFVHLLFAILLLISSADGTVTETIAKDEFWDGINAYVAVDREIIQKKLNEWHISNSGLCDAPKLYLPETPIFPGVIGANKHAVFIGVGNLTFHDFDPYADSHLWMAEAVTMVGVVIPLLADSPKGVPQYSLALGIYYEKNLGDFPKSNVMYPYFPVDEIRINNNRFVMRNGSEEMTVSLNRYTNPCKPTSPVVRHELDHLIRQEFHLGNPEPDFSFCDRHPIDNHFCETAKRIRCEVSRSVPNICQTPWHALKRHACQGTMEILNVTPILRDAMLLPPDPIEVFASEVLIGNFSIGLKYPCIENECM
ncbi:hypothetical protein HOLleu_27603 [Holothuria leucospilota]|uniref:Uncharacterized protein n=1 Tax=Holothuria leucospilota TaxID=206669 RepID=A0A9Q1BQL8_HOLLE|nr:hypothetical protein HOLleu_27603 [Holothuria leucospilota]